jgi:hypothetical protein
MTTGVGAILLFFGSLTSSASGTTWSSLFFDVDAVSSRSDSLPLRRLPPTPGMPLTELLALCVPCPCAGVSGGVQPTGPEFAAAIPGTEDMDGVGACITPPSPPPGANDDAVAMLETELLLVGLPGLAGTNELGDAGNPTGGCFTAAVAVMEADMVEVVGV